MRRRKIRYAVVGLGNIAQVAVLPAFKHAAHNSELALLISGDRAKRTKLTRRYSTEAAGDYEELEDLLAAHRIDAAYIALPNTLHAEMTQRVARAGVHVLCEKPMATTTRDCRAMIDAAERNRVRLMIAYRLHFDPGNLDTVKVVTSGKIGAPRVMVSMLSHRVRAGDIRMRREVGGGALLDLGIYCINAARYLFRDEPLEVRATQVFRRDARTPESVDQVCAATLTFPGDRIAQFTVSQDIAGASFYRVVGTKGEVVLEGAYDYVEGMRQRLSIDNRKREKAFPRHDQFAAELVYFSRCLIEGRDPEPSGQEGLADLTVAEAISESARRGTSVRLAGIHKERRPHKRQAIEKPPVGRIRTIHAPSPSFN